ncbi:amidohydrolase [Methanosalsum zhilinae DSM 4017]|uniref:Amidohydrolase n=1 Tax=Methanosalsum zhilinae (strain DSM 4017 / NBRC 107636 / OCM 62 / WeN5) TaxID=679901 RepID=F7XP07_METZD|nr:amidohydrolase [Methanosalsum zhilinae]AEH60199.1 amidohydrolase [Methanosalsum zhilinae DSM 4017]
MNTNHDLNEWLIRIRREFHSIPEKSFREYKTQQKIIDILNDIGIEYEMVAGTGIVATIDGIEYGKCIALRADMDGLEVTEQLSEKNLEYISRHPGFMHACGHDAHMAMVLGAAKLLNKNRRYFRGSIKIIFQPAEEQPPGGAREMIAQGALEGVDAIIGIHVFTNLDTGKVALKKGALMASSNMFSMTIQGKGGHHSDYDKCIDPIAIASEFICSIRKEIDQILGHGSYAMGFGNIHSGSQFNRIPDCAYMDGSVRTFSCEHIGIIENTFRNVLDNLMKKYSLKHLPDLPSYTLKLSRGYPVLINNPGFTESATRFLVNNFDNIDPEIKEFFGSEDFAFYLRKIPGTFILLGTKNIEKGIVEGNHSNRFDIDEDILIKGSNIMYCLSMDFLKTPEPYLI